MSDWDEPLRITVSAGEPGQAGIAVQGELDSAKARELADAYSEALKRAKLESDATGQERQPLRISLDLEEMSFIDSGGLRMLIVIQREAERQGVELTVLAPPDPVIELLELAGVSGRMNLVRESQAARREAEFLERVELEFEADDRAPRLARAAVRESLGRILSDSALANAVLMTSELVTNGVVHSAGGLNVGLRVTTFPDVVRVEVDDPGAGFDPSARPDLPDGVPAPEMGGRGLFVVDRCAIRWGTSQAETDRGRRFSVWFELEPKAG